MPSDIRMVHVAVSYEDEMVVSQWMCYLIAFGHENGTCIGYEDEVVVTQWVFPFDCLRACIGELQGERVISQRLRHDKSLGIVS